jgi:hypothetical protein
MTETKAFPELLSRLTKIKADLTALSIRIFSYKGPDAAKAKKLVALAMTQRAGYIVLDLKKSVAYLCTADAKERKELTHPGAALLSFGKKGSKSTRKIFKKHEEAMEPFFLEATTIFMGIVENLTAQGNAKMDEADALNVPAIQS